MDYLEEISEAVDYVCFISDEQWGGKLSDSEELSPTLKAMVACSDIMIGIGGGDICRDELLAGKERENPSISIRRKSNTPGQSIARRGWGFPNRIPFGEQRIPLFVIPMAIRLSLMYKHEHKSGQFLETRLLRKLLS